MATPKIPDQALDELSPGHDTIKVNYTNPYGAVQRVVGTYHGWADMGCHRFLVMTDHSVGSKPGDRHHYVAVDMENIKSITRQVAEQTITWEKRPKNPTQGGQVV